MFLPCLQFLEDHFDRLVELLIFTCVFSRGIVIHVDVGLDPRSFHYPLFSFEVESGKFRFSEHTAVQERQRTAYPHDPTPGPLPDYFAQSVLFEAIGEDVTVGGGKFISQAYKGPVNQSTGDWEREPCSGRC